MGRGARENQGELAFSRARWLVSQVIKAACLSFLWTMGQWAPTERSGFWRLQFLTHSGPFGWEGRYSLSCDGSFVKEAT